VSTATPLDRGRPREREPARNTHVWFLGDSGRLGGEATGRDPVVQCAGDGPVRVVWSAYESELRHHVRPRIHRIEHPKCPNPAPVLSGGRTRSNEAIR